MAVQKVKKGGKPVWRARIVVDGKQRTAFRRTKAEAVAAEAGLRTAPAATEKREVKIDPTYDEFWTRVVAYCTTAGKRPWRESTAAAKHCAHQRVSPVIGGLKMSRITAAKIDHLAVVLAGQYARTTVSVTLANVRLALGLAKKWGVVETVPQVEATPPPPGKVGDHEWYREAELQQLLSKLAPHWRRLALVAARTGLRIGELQGVRWCDVDMPRRQLCVERTWHRATRNFGPPKSGKSRTVPLPPDAHAVLTDMRREQGREPHELVFSVQRADVPFAVKSFDRALCRASKGTGKRRGTHILRHTWASHCVLAGVNSRAIMMVAGWSSETMLARYAHLRVEDFASQFDRLAGLPGCDLDVTAGTPRSLATSEMH